MTDPARGPAASARLALCVDLGSTFTKALLVDLDDAVVLAAAEHPTTVATDVLDGYDACRADLVAADPRAGGAVVLACSSAGGGLRVAVLGNEPLVTAEAGRRVALSSGGHVVAVVAMAADADPGAQVLAARPDVVLLVGGTDGGNPAPLVAGARALVAAGWRGPVVVAGNAAAADDVVRVLGDVPHAVAANVVPRIGVLDPAGARAAVREVFLSHVIGGKRLTRPERRAELEALVRGATPDVVLRGVEVLADEVGDVVVVDVGGATTDVHAVVEVDPETTDPDLGREVVATTRVGRTVEGDLGMRWSAPTTVAQDPGLAADPALVAAAAARGADPAYLPLGAADHDADEAVARAAVALALRRHAGRARVVLGPGGRVVERTGRDLRPVDLVVGSGGVLRHGRPGVAARVLGAAVGAGAAAADGGGWQVPEAPRLVVDHAYVLAAVGLLADERPEVARRLARGLVPGPVERG